MLSIGNTSKIPKVDPKFYLKTQAELGLNFLIAIHIKYAIMEMLYIFVVHVVSMFVGTVR